MDCDPIGQVFLRAGITRQKDYLESESIWLIAKCTPCVYLQDGRDKALRTQNKMPKKIRKKIYISKAEREKYKFVLEGRRCSFVLLRLEFWKYIFSKIDFFRCAHKKINFGMSKKKKKSNFITFRTRFPLIPK